MVTTYEEQLDADLDWAMSEGSKFFEERGAVQGALRNIAQRLNELGIPYAVVEGMALFAYGFRRFTEDVDILVDTEGLKAIHSKLVGLGYRPKFEGSKNLRDASLGVSIEFIVTGQYPGDGKPKPVVFPPPGQVSEEIDGISYINLVSLVELKLASARGQDLVDVEQLIKILGLSRDFSEKLNYSVRSRYDERWNNANPPDIRYVRIWRNEPGFADATILNAMIEDGVVVERSEPAQAYLVTTDPTVARKYDMHPEDEFLAE